MAFKSYETLDDVRAIVTEQIPEGVNLEYKGSDVLINRDANTVCKTVSALANSAGGTFIIGIEMKNLVPVRVDDGTPGPSKRDWIYQIINGGTFPAVETVEIRELQTPSGTIYVVDVSPSPQAPHQSNDRKYYKRRGSHSDVMEHYEIEDVRNRPKRPLQPLRAELQTQSILAHLRLTNAHETDAISDLRCEIDANFPMQRDSLGALGERGIRALAPRSELYFHLGSLIEILQTNKPVVTFKFSYTFHDAPMAQSTTFHLADWNRSAIMQSPVERALGLLGEKLDKMNGQIEGLRKTAEAYTNAVADGSGLRLSQRTLHALKGVPQLFDPREFDAAGYCIIASISLDEAYAIERLRYYPNAQAKGLYEQISPDARTRFEKHFKVDFSEDES